ncbi:MAG: hypothetical protein JO156_14600 [Solirubrobacterales bacterium]|nr:hypothetical protein [Solirubrobacterales bacterium]
MRRHPFPTWSLIALAALALAAVPAVLDLTNDPPSPTPRLVLRSALGKAPFPGVTTPVVRRGVRKAPQGRPHLRARATAPSLARMIGQQVMVRMDGLSADQALLSRIRHGDVGGVILYSENIATRGQVKALIGELQGAARSGGNPPLLISTDQEGGSVKRLSWAPPSLTPPQMGVAGALASRRQGQRTGEALRAVGINVDLAPVLDVARSSSSFIWQQGRSFGMRAPTVIGSAIPFALGLQSARVAPTGKHFPGVGGAGTDTDFALETLTSHPADLAPYRVLIADRLPLIMVSTGVYPKLDRSRVPAALSRTIITGLLRQRMGYQGAVITDDLERPTGYSTSDAVVRAARAGADIILVSTTEQAGGTAYQALLAAASRGMIPRATVRAAYARVLALKKAYAAG